MLASSPNSSRPLLLCLKCHVYEWDQARWQYGWLASEYWAKESDIVVDIKCPDDFEPSYDDTYPRVNTQLLLNSKFAYCPGGGSVPSYCLAESLGLGAIPVLTPDLLVPLDKDWSGCIIRVSASRIVDLPRLLRNIPEEETASRRRECKILFDEFIGWKDADEPTEVVFDIQRLFLATIEEWWARVEGAVLSKYRVLD